MGLVKKLNMLPMPPLKGGGRLLGRENRMSKLSIASDCLKMTFYGLFMVPPLRIAAMIYHPTKPFEPRGNSKLLDLVAAPFFVSAMIAALVIKKIWSTETVSDNPPTVSDNPPEEFNWFSIEKEVSLLENFCKEAAEHSLVPFFFGMVVCCVTLAVSLYVGAKGTVFLASLFKQVTSEVLAILGDYLSSYSSDEVTNPILKNAKPILKGALFQPFTHIERLSDNITSGSSNALAM